MTNGHEKVDNRIGKKLTDLLQKKKNQQEKRPHSLAANNQVCLGFEEIGPLS